MTYEDDSYGIEEQDRELMMRCSAYMPQWVKNIGEYLGEKAKCYGRPIREDDLSTEHLYMDWENGNHESSRCIRCGLSEDIDMSKHYGDDW